MAREKTYAPPYLVAALDLQNAESSTVAAAVRGRLTFFDVLTPGSETRLDLSVGQTTQAGAEWFLAIGSRGFFVAPRASYTRQHENLFDGRGLRRRVPPRHAQRGAGRRIQHGPEPRVQSGLRSGKRERHRQDWRTAAPRGSRHPGVLADAGGLRRPGQPRAAPSRPVRESEPAAIHRVGQDRRPEHAPDDARTRRSDDRRGPDVALQAGRTPGAGVPGWRGRLVVPRPHQPQRLHARPSVRAECVSARRACAPATSPSPTPATSTRSRGSSKERSVACTPGRGSRRAPPSSGHRTPRSAPTSRAACILDTVVGPAALIGSVGTDGKARFYIGLGPTFRR